jgi:hypothetical protein
MIDFLYIQNKIKKLYTLQCDDYVRRRTSDGQSRLPCVGAEVGGR